MAEGTAKDAHIEKSVKGGASKNGRMAEGPAKDAHREKSVKGGAPEAGRMIGRGMDEKKCLAVSTCKWHIGWTQVDAFLQPKW
jgi:hypothetical protein